MSGAAGKRKLSERQLYGLLTGLALAIILVPGTIGFVNEAGYEQTGRDNAREYAKYSDQKVGQSCRGIPAMELVDCFSKARIESELEKRQYDHEEADLVAQRNTANWTQIMGLAALVGMALSAVGILLVWRTFNATKEGNQISERIGKAQVRAYLSVKAMALAHTGEGNFRLYFSASNSGQSPARKAYLMVKFRLLVNGMKKAHRTRIIPIGDLSAGSTEEKLGPFKFSAPLEELVAGERRIPIFAFDVSAEYIDVFDTKQTDGFQFETLKLHDLTKLAIREKPTTMIVHGG